MSYDQLVNIARYDFSHARVLLVGAGAIGREYCNAFKAMGIQQVTVISRTKETAAKCSKDFGFEAYGGGFEKALNDLKFPFDLVIVSVPIELLSRAASFVLERGNYNILVEKPGALYSDQLAKWSAQTTGGNVRIRIAYNRCVYPGFWKLKELTDQEGGITSCFYTFTEWIHRIDFSGYGKESLQRWGVSNSLHVIAMAHALIGNPAKLTAVQKGSLPWHPNGAQFTGCGSTEKGIPFSYHADWESSGRWGIEIMTRHCAYRLVPLEELYVCKKGETAWSRIDVTSGHPGVKSGLAEEVALMLLPDLEKQIPLVTLKSASEFTRASEIIFGYNAS